MDLALLLKIPLISVQVLFQNARQGQKKEVLRGEGVSTSARGSDGEKDGGVESSDPYEKAKKEEDYD